MNVGLLGSGVVAKTLGAGFLQHGHAVMLGTRSPDKLADWQADHSDAQVGSFEATAAFGEVLVLAVKGTAAADALRLVDPADLRGKTILDATNPIAEAPPENGVLQYFTKQNESLMEGLQAEFAEAHFVKAFNQVSSNRMVNPAYEHGPPTMFICGNDADAKATAHDILEQFGWEPFDLGTAEAARPAEALCMLYCIPGFQQHMWTHAFKLLRDDG